MFRNNRRWRISLGALGCLLLLGAPAALTAGEPLRLLVMVGSTETRTVNRAFSEAQKMLQAPGNRAVAFALITNEEVGSGAADATELKRADVVLVDTMHTVLARWVTAQADFSHSRVYTLRGSAGEEKRIIAAPEAYAYYSLPSTRNLTNLLLWTLAREKGFSLHPAPPQKLPEMGYFHPAGNEVFTTFAAYRQWYQTQGRFKDGQPWVGLAEYSSNVRPGEPEPICAAVVDELEKQAMNVLPVFFLSNTDGMSALFLDESGKSRISALCSFAFRFASADPAKSWGAFAKADVPVINLMRRSYGTLDEWRESPQGLSPMEIAWQLGGPEISGLIEPSLTGGKVEMKDAQGRRQFEPQPLTQNIARLAQRVRAWCALRQQPNAQKKVAIIYYNHSPGKQNVGAAYLNVFRSLDTILHGMKDAGYAIDGKAPGEDAIKQLVLQYGRNIGSWAPGELDALRAGGRTVEIPLTQYCAWYDQLDAEFRTAVEKQWGRPEDTTVMCRDGKLILSVITLGNVILLPQPSRGWSDDPLKTYHDPALYPHHQYIACYLWLRYGFQADAVVHLGTHGTHEWLPGKGTGLSQSCPPEAVLGDLPNIYPYIMDNIGEGLQAKRRGKAVVIDHLTPAFVKAGKYDATRDLSALIAEYEANASGHPDLAAQKLARISTMAAKMGIDKELGLTVIAADKIQELEHYLNDITASAIPNGLHIFGNAPTAERLGDFRALIQERNPALEPQAVERDLIASGPAELSSLLRALRGGFVSPGKGNDPIRNPAALPTGRNFYGFDPDRTPSADAWTLGARLADEMVVKYKNEKGAYPRKIALILWSVETQRNEGTQIATALRLLGMKPVWDRNGKVIGTQPIPGAQLGRPRIDVHLQASGLFRDSFPGVIHLLDKAAREAGKLQDAENFIARHTQKIQAALQSSGMSANEAEAYAGVRVFSTGPGGYSGRVQELVPNSGFWEKDADIADVFMRQVSYGYGAGVWGKPLPGAYAKSLEDVDLAMHTRSSSLFKGLDNDDVFGDLGGVALAVRRVTGKTPTVMIARQDNPQAAVVEDLAKFLGSELRARYLNPRWIEGMKKEGYAGARMMAQYTENFWGFQVTTPGSVSAEQWQQVFDVYVKDQHQLGLKEFFNKENAWAYQSIAARMLEAVRKDYWNAPEEVRKTLAKEYALNVIEQGVACCDHTCNNPALTQMVATLISLPGMLAPAQVAQFTAAMEKATGGTVAQNLEKRAKKREALAKAAPSQPEPSNQEKSALTPAQRKQEKKTLESKPDKAVEGYEMKKQEREPQPFTSSGAPWAVFVAALIAAGLFLYGWMRRRE